MSMEFIVLPTPLLYSMSAEYCALLVEIYFCEFNNKNNEVKYYPNLYLAKTQYAHSQH